MHGAMAAQLTRALFNNSENVQYTNPGIRSVEPTDGAFVAGLGGALAPQQVLLLPFGDGAEGSAFKVRLYGWYHFGDVSRAGSVTWLPLVLAEMRVVLGAVNGLPYRNIESKERFACKLELLSGNPGFYGRLVDGPIAHAKVDLAGCHKFSFDFAQDELSPGVFGNVLFAHASAF